ncbi:PREDICTED: neuropeptide Y receptor-like [Priapulus caudatus]|uniref:Neuropeptide Y receptor-like n=1 Tax=Priapulus caudatus TaxID=37621 RepID=A0ABM1E2M5_PRICU|nr:PREDICTED: neuropeptide Y receptor-like [Priapulus caudatus]
MIIMYGTAWLLAIGGNTVVCYIVLAYQRMRTITNYFIVNLALGDILMAILCIPFDFVANQLLNYWPFGAVLCPLVTYAQAVSVFVSSYTLVSISIDRYIAIIYPLRPRMTACQAKLAIAIIWVISLSIPLPIAIVSRTVAAPFSDGALRDRCEEQWTSGGAKLSRSRYSMALMSLQYFLPLAVLTFTYSVITHELWGKRVPGEAEDTRDQRLERSKRKVVFKGSLKIVYISGVNKMIKMMITVVVIFALLWLPLNVLIVLGDHYDLMWRWKYIRYTWFLSHWLAMMHSCCNPFIYCYMNARFRSGFRYVFRFLPCRCCRETPTDSDVYETELKRRNTYSTTVPMAAGVNMRQMGRGLSNCIKHELTLMTVDDAHGDANQLSCISEGDNVVMGFTQPNGGESLTAV